jgi:hypothetical protein
MANGTLAASQIEMESLSGTGVITITPPATDTNRAITLPDAAGQVVLNSATQTLTNKTIQGGAITSGTAVASTSGTSIDFTGIPSWVKRITVMFSGVSTNGTSVVQVQLGDAGGVETAGYLGAVASSAATSLRSNFSSGFLLNDSTSGGAGYLRHGPLTLTLLSGNIWVASLIIARSETNEAWYGAGSKTLSDTLTQVRITTVNGTDTFDAGSINIMYEG